MVEKPNVRERHRDTVLVAGFNNVIIANGAARLRNEIDARLMSTFNVIAEREECIGR